MTADEFWYGVPRLAKSYKEAQELRNERRNEEMWVQGLYVYDALSVVISNAFGGKGAKKQKYMEKPIDINPSKQKEQTPEEARQIVIDQLDAWKTAWDSNHGEQ